MKDIIIIILLAALVGVLFYSPTPKHVQVTAILPDARWAISGVAPMFINGIEVHDGDLIGYELYTPTH